jgi:ribosomal protein L10
MRSLAALLSLLLASGAALQLPACARPAAAARCAARMGSDAAVAVKAATVEGVKASMEDSALLFSVRTDGITVNDMNTLRQKFPEDVKVQCVKNTLVRRAAEAHPKFQGGDSLLEYSNYWFFVPEGSMRATVDLWNDWVKESKQVRCVAPA